jgi:hypothetical protein
MNEIYIVCHKDEGGGEMKDELVLFESKLSRFEGNRLQNNFSCIAIGINNWIKVPGERRCSVFSEDEIDKMKYAIGNSGKKYERGVYHIRFFCAEEVLDYLQTICDTGAIIEPAVKSWYLMEVYRSFSIVDGLFCSQKTYFTTDTLQYTISMIKYIIPKMDERLLDLVRNTYKESEDLNSSWRDAHHAHQMTRFYRQMRNGFSELDMTSTKVDTVINLGGKTTDSKGTVRVYSPEEDPFEHLRY